MTVSFVDDLVAAQPSSDHSKGGFKDRYPHPHSSHRPHPDIAGPKPRKVLLGAIAFIVAIAVAITGAIDSARIATPEPTAMRLVRSVTSVGKAHRFERIIGLSQTHQKSAPSYSAWTTSSTFLIELTAMPNFIPRRATDRRHPTAQILAHHQRATWGI